MSPPDVSALSQMSTCENDKLGHRHNNYARTHSLFVNVEAKKDGKI